MTNNLETEVITLTPNQAAQLLALSVRMAAKGKSDMAFDAMIAVKKTSDAPVLLIKEKPSKEGSGLG